MEGFAQSKRGKKMIEWEVYSPVLAMILGNAAFIIPLFLWNRAESRSDIRHIESQMQSMREMTSFQLLGIREEMKDFHGRLERQDAEFKAYIMHRKG
jgi:hypothetical protein